jgi:DeoR family transcriptional regulator, fructose operon transcriptional repressor
VKKEQALVEERKREILEYVTTRRKASVGELCSHFGVSSATMRSDLRDLEEGGLLVRTHGGAMVKDKARFEPDAKEKEDKRSAEKLAIALRAVECIEDGDTIVLDTGSTTFALAAQLGAKRDLTVLTNDLAIALRLEQHPSATIHVLGGMVRKRFHCTLGSRAEESLKGLTVDKAFMGANAFSIDKGASTPDLPTAGLKRLMMAIADKVYLLVDSSKFGKNSFAGFAPPGEIDCLITDSISDEEHKALEDFGVEVLVASKPNRDKGE